MKTKVLFITLLLSISLNSQEKQAEPKSDIDKAVKAKDAGLINFDSIKNVLKNDNLEKKAIEKNKKIEAAKARAKKREVSRYDFPREEDFWNIMSEYWLVRNAQILKWDFQKPDYGLEQSFKYFLEKTGYFEKKFKILLVNTSEVTHFALPSSRGEYILLLSAPFIRILDLSKMEISLLLMEDVLRNDMGYFRKKVMTKEVSELIGGNFYEKKVDKKVIEKVYDNYDEIIHAKGFNFQEQFHVTKKMESLLKTDLVLWKTYLRLLKKIDNLSKSNILYKKYNKIYPSPEMQINWITPKTGN